MCLCVLIKRCSAKAVAETIVSAKIGTRNAQTHSKVGSHAILPDFKIALVNLKGTLIETKSALRHVKIALFGLKFTLVGPRTTKTAAGIA